MGRPPRAFFFNSVGVMLWIFSLLFWFVAATPLISQETQDPEVAGRDLIDRSVNGLLQEYPGVRIETFGSGEVYVYGRSMTPSEDPFTATEEWLTAHGAALGNPDAVLLPTFADPIKEDRFTCFGYDQQLEGLPVIAGIVRVLVLDDGRDQLSEVVYVAGRLARSPVGGFGSMVIDAASALRIAKGLPENELLINWETPTLVVVPRGLLPAARCWRVQGSNLSRLGDPLQRSTYVDTGTGDVILQLEEIHHIDIDGTVEALITVNNTPDIPTNPEVQLPLNGVQVSIPSGATVSTGTDGTFSLPHASTDAATVQVVLQGSWVNVFHDQGPELVLQQSVTPPGNVLLLMNPGATEFDTAQVNGYHYTTLTHDFFRERTAGIGGIDVPITCNVNLNQSCNAFYSSGGQSINFFAAGGGCPNTAFESVVTHEYGHFIVNRLNLVQNAFGEGYGDCVGILMADDPIIGREFLGPGTWVRNIEEANTQFPCPDSEVHFCGQVLAGCWWDTRVALGTTQGSAEGLAIAQQLFVDWSVITIGMTGGSNESATAATAIEALVADDDDGNTDNGSPHYTEICAGFSSHNIDCPVIQNIGFSFPDGVPEQLLPNRDTVIRVDILPISGLPEPGSGTVHYRTGGAGAFTAAPLSQIGIDQYEAEIPGQLCGENVEFYFQASDTTGVTVTSPGNAPLQTYEAGVFEAIEVIAEDDFEGGSTWTGGLTGDTATTGAWVLVDPNPTQAQPGSDHSEVGTLCWVTGQGTPGGSLGENDVDGGFTTLLSPVFDLSGTTDPIVSYWRWYSNDTGAAPNADTLVVEISADGGGNYSTLEIVGPAGEGSNGGWFFAQYHVSDFITPSSQVRFRFVASDLAAGSLVEAAIDDFGIESRICSIEPLFIRGDTNLDASIDITDAVNILVGIFGGGVLGCFDAADIDDSGSLNVADAIVLLNYLFRSEGQPDPPFPGCGVDPTDDPLDCAGTGNCP
ncbi:MAG TPA: hypothetical protein EYN79_00330 [Planctomycetes bacterium]|nr:hypothetical protein [Planctomycetota bacterium]HIN80353.1 hypothetical protein [Planctomycetota bacterium]